MPATAAPIGSTIAASNLPAKPAASTPDSRSAAALALSSEPTFDEGTAQRIRDAALSYSDLAVRGGWPTIPADAKFAYGVAGPQDDLLRQRLILSGDLAADKASGPYDDILAAGLKRFQARHGLAATGVMTPRTLAALNVPVQKRIQQLEASLERVVNMGFGFGQRYVVVNIPAAYAEAVEDDKVVRRYRVIVGKTEKPSPTLTAEITNVNLNPTWTVPASITKNEIAAHMRKDPNYLVRSSWTPATACWILTQWTGPRSTLPTLRCGRNPEPGMRSVRCASTCPTPIRSTCTTPTRRVYSAMTTASIRTAARGSIMFAISPPGC
jgi:lipoprotein-anchoring transpeptidase ErfK/SrfK